MANISVSEKCLPSFLGYKGKGEDNNHPFCISVLFIIKFLFIKCTLAKGPILMKAQILQMPLSFHILKNSCMSSDCAEKKERMEILRVLIIPSTSDIYNMPSL